MKIVLIVIAFIVSGCTPCLQKEPRFYNPKVEKCKPDACTECVDITKIK